MSDPDDNGLTEKEREALHQLQLGVENLYQGYGNLLDFHHTIGRGMDHLHEAETKLREAEQEEAADMLRNEALPTGVFEGMWTYEVVEAFKREFLTEITGFEEEIREDLADGQEHVMERRQQQNWRERAENRSDQ